jgi:hypothetical protein
MTPKLQPTAPSNPKTLPSDLIPNPNPHVAFDLADLALTNWALTNIGGLALSDVARDLTLELTALTSLTMASMW